MRKAPVPVQGGEREHMALIKKIAQAQSHASATRQWSIEGKRGQLMANQVNNTRLIYWISTLVWFTTTLAMQLCDRAGCPKLEVPKICSYKTQAIHKHENVTRDILLSTHTHKKKGINFWFCCETSNSIKSSSPFDISQYLIWWNGSERKREWKGDLLHFSLIFF